MKPERWLQIEKIVNSALDLPAVGRKAYLDETFGSNKGLREKSNVSWPARIKPRDS